MPQRRANATTHPIPSRDTTTGGIVSLEIPAPAKCPGTLPTSHATKRLRMCTSLSTKSGIATPPTPATTNVFCLPKRPPTATHKLLNAHSYIKLLPLIDDDDKTAVTNNCSSHLRHTSDAATASTTLSTSLGTTDSCSSTINTINITLGTNKAIADSGASAHFLLPNVNISNKRKADHPLNITLPDGKVIQSTHVGNLNLPGLGDSATLAHVLPGLAHSSLLSIKQLCDNGCHVNFANKDCKIYRKADLMLVGKRHPATGLWVVPTNNRSISSKPPSAFAIHAAHNAYQTSSKAKLIQFLHQCVFSPPPSTWITAINNNQFASWPGLTADAVWHYLPDSIATAKGHMKKIPAGDRSTHTKPPNTVHMPPLANPAQTQPPSDADYFPSLESNNINHIFCWTALADQIDDITYTDLTGRFPTMSLENNQCIFVAYDYTTAMPSLSRPSPTANPLPTSKHSTTYFNVLDNEASHAITEYLRQHDIKWQFVPPNKHRVNAMVRAIQTFKNHFIPGLCSTDRDFPSQLWDKLLQQAQDSLNMLCTSRIDPTKSTYEILEGPHDFNRNPWAPPDEAATTRASWGPRGTGAWYIGPAMHHYQSYEFYVPETRAYRISTSAKFFPSTVGIKVTMIRFNETNTNVVLFCQLSK
eukprot:CCRYP_011974-RA/>CCRYP_011974-RA protein AED:0.11 eAED:0.08 QI:0/0/0/0.66/0/0.33/3/0/643